MSITRTVSGALRLSGTAFNGALLAGFVYGTSALWNMAEDHFAAAGGIPSADLATVAAIAADPTSAVDLWHFGAAWFLAVAAAACAWMSALGARWAYLSAIRFADR